MLEKVFVVLALLLFTGAFLGLLGGASGADGNIVAQAGYAGIYGITLILVALRLNRFLHFSTREPLLLLLVGFALMSVLWSVAPEVTLRRGIALLGTTLFGAYLAMRFSLREQLRLLAWALAIGALFSLAFAVALPEYAIWSKSRGDALQGIYHQKNVLGRLMGLGAMVFFLLAVGGRRYRWVKWGGFALSVAMLLLANSQTSLVVLLILLALFPFYRALREAYTIALPVIIAGALAGAGVLVWLFSNVESVFSALDRDLTLTGRTELWKAVLDKIAERPWFGYGYNAFWMGWEGESAEVLLRIAPFTSSSDYEPTHAHNGVLEVWLDLGLVGLILFGLVLLVAFARAIRLIRENRAVESVWPLTYLTMLLLIGATYPIGLERNSIWWVLLVAAVLHVANRPRYEKKHEPPRPDLVHRPQKQWSRVG